MASNIDQKLRKFLVDKPDLIIRYESMDSMMPVEYFITDIVDAYNKYTKINKNADFNTTIENAFKLAIRLNTNIIDAFVELSASETAQKSGYDITHQYFKEIRGIYNKHNNDFNIEYCEENRDKLIEMNLKTVISIAKKYTGLGLSLNELISAGNLGLVIAYDKFDPSRSKLKDDILQSISSMSDTFKCGEFEKNIQQFLTYGDVKKKFDERFKTKNELLTKEYVSKWINENVYNAKFNSIATMWIRAYILIAIDNESRIVKKPKSEIYADKEKSGSYKKEVTIDIDAPTTEDSTTSVGDLMQIEDDSPNEMMMGEAYDIFKSNLAKLLTGVKTRDRSIFLKKFGIGLPRPMLPKEIAKQEKLSIARVSQIFQNVLEIAQKNQVKYNIDPHTLFEIVKHIQ